ncbi:glutamate-cysteine ligase family protein [Thiococcus pfennigii]|uniref:glutamate-cysteine ligase family protein n=1 Tax=Thiococcus pfennigii TaxID=1057 RepID=UPI001905DE47
MRTPCRLAMPAGVPRPDRREEVRVTNCRGCESATVEVGLELEYLIVDRDGSEPGRVRDFTNLAFDAIAPLLEDKPGRLDPDLATGDLGIRSGYWYLEGDERQHEDGRFRTLIVKGIEIRTPPAAGVGEALDWALEIERELAAVLARHGLGLAIVGFNPVRPAYDFDPPLNAWEREERRRDPSYDGSEVSTLSYGPDVNLSFPGWGAERSLEAARKLSWYSPFIVPFSFSSPFHAGRPWQGWSKRTYERSAVRPAVRLYLDSAKAQDLAAHCTLVQAARRRREVGRIEYKAFDAFLSAALLRACCHLLVGICLAPDLPGRGEAPDLERYRRAALAGFADEEIRAGAGEVLAKARKALFRIEDTEGWESLALLEEMLAARRIPAEDLLAAYRENGLMYKPGGLADTLPALA